MITGGGFAVSGAASVTGSEVLIYNAGSNYNGTRYAGNAPMSGDLTSWSGSNLGSALADDADATEDADGPATFDEPADLAVLDQFFQQLAGDGTEESSRG